MKNNTILFLLLSALFLMQTNAQMPPPINGVSCSSGTPNSYIYNEDFEYVSSADAITNGGWSGDIKDHNQNNDYPKNGVWGITLESELRSGGTGPNTAHSGNKYLMFDANGSTNRGKIVSPAIDLSNSSEALELSFYMHAYGIEMGTLLVGVSTTKTGTFTTVFKQEGQYQTSGSDPWAPVGIDLTAYVGQIIYLQFDYTALPAATANKGDMSIDYIRLQTCGEFCVPGNLGLSGLTDSSINLNWSSGSTQTQWEYILQVEGTGAPSGNGILAPSDSVTISNLTDGVSYEVYYRSVCSSGYSEWVGPINFTTELSYNKTIDCSGNDYTLNYCYKSVKSNENPQEFSYTSSNGNPLIIFFNEGVVGKSIFSGDDELVVKDGEGKLLYRGIGNNGNLAGLSFISNEKSPTSNVLNFYIDATSLGGCFEDGFKPINASISCISCNNIPEATFSKEFSSDCNTNPEYYLNVNVNSLGDASSLKISDNLGLYSETTNVIGLSKIGPFEFNTDIQITVADSENNSCFTKSKFFNTTTCPPVNDDYENAAELTITPRNNCSNGYKATLDEATPSPDTIPAISCSSTNGNDVWFKFVATYTAHTIIFKDFFYNEHLDHILYKVDSSDNLTELYCHNNWDDFAANPIMVTPQLTVGDTYYLRVYTQKVGIQEYDFSICVQDPPPGGEASLCNNAEPLCFDETGTYKTSAQTGIVNYMQAGCLEWTANPTWMTFEIQESGSLNLTISQTGGNASNDVDVAIFGPYSSLDAVCSTYMYDTPIACTAKNTNIEKLRIPNAVAGEKYIILSSNVSFYDHDLTVNQSNFNEDGAAIIRNRYKEPTIINPEPLCDELEDNFELFDLTRYDSEILDGDTTFNVSYYTSRDDAENDVNEINSIEISAGVSQNVYARIHTGPNSFCYSITNFPLTVIESPIANSISPSSICDELNDGFEIIDLTTFSNEITENTANVSVKYYLSEAQAILGSSPLYPEYKMEAEASQEFFARVENENHCFSTTSFTVNVGLLSAEFDTSEGNYEICYSGESPIEISLINTNFVTTDSDITINWFRNGEEILFQNETTLSVSTPGTYSVKISKNNTNCSYSTSTVVTEKNCSGNIMFPQGISPNGDGINDSFDLREAQVKRLEVYNRNGVLVYYRDNYTNEWHGQSSNRKELPVGVYFYTTALKNGTNKNGWIHLNR